MWPFDLIAESYRAGVARKRLERLALEKQIELFESIWNRMPAQTDTWFDIATLYTKDAKGELVVNFTPAILKQLRSEARYLSYFNPHGIAVWRKYSTFVLGSQGFRYVAEPIRPEDRKAADRCKRIDDDWQRFMEKELWWDRENEMARRIVVDGEAFIETFRRGNRMATMRFIDPEFVASDTAGKHLFGVVTDPNDAETHLGYYVNGAFKDAANVLQLRANCMRNMPRGITTFSGIMNLIRQHENLLDARLKLNIMRATIIMIRKFKGGLTGAKIREFLSSIKSGTTADGTPTEGKFPGTILNATENIEYEMQSPNIQGADAQYDMKAFMHSIAAGSGLAYYAISGDSNDNKYAGAMTAESPMLKEFVWWQTKLVWDFTRLQERLLLAMGYTPDELDGIRLNAYPADIESKDVLAQAQADEIYENIGAESLTGICKRRGRDYEEIRLEREREEAQMPTPAGDEQ